MPYTFDAQQWLPYDLPLVFAFFGNPENLPRLMPPWQHTRIEQATFTPPPQRPHTAGRLPGVIAGPGTRMTISFRAFPLSPLRLSWDAEITELVWNEHFCDVQHRGPFRAGKHCHYLRPAPRPDWTGTQPAPDGTLVSDHVEYDLPLGPFGTLANTLFMRRQLRTIFRIRHQRTRTLLPRFAASVAR